MTEAPPLHDLEARARWHLGIGYVPDLSEPPDDWEDDDYEPEPFAVCLHCSGTGGDPWDDYIQPCAHCDGEGYEWWG